MASSKAWSKIFDDYNIHSHDFDSGPFLISAKDIKKSTSHFDDTSEKEVRILCKQDSRSDRPEVFKKNNLFLLPIKNGQYAIIKGEGYINLPTITSKPIKYISKLNFHLDTAVIGDSEMQHLDMAYASSIIRTFMNDNSLVLTIRGRKYTPEFKFRVGPNEIIVKSVQTEVDAGYEGKDKVVLVEAKSTKSKDSIIRQMYYPYRQWSAATNKQVYTLFFERDHINDTYNIWQFGFSEVNDYNSIKLIRSARYTLTNDMFEEKKSIDN